MNNIPEQYAPYVEQRPWGSFEQFAHNEQTTVKLLYVNPGSPLSLQAHNQRQEFWKIVVGNPKITVGDTVYQAKPGDTFFIDVQTRHRIEGGSEQAVILEVARGTFDENDIVRFEDRYGRA